MVLLEIDFLAAVQLRVRWIKFCSYFEILCGHVRVVLRQIQSFFLFSFIHLMLVNPTVKLMRAHLKKP